jgi:hypothetical protein
MTKRKRSSRQKGERIFGRIFMAEAFAPSPIPSDLWLACLDVYEAAAELRMPVENPETRFMSGDRGGYVPKDTAMNRGILAVLDFANDPPLHLALIARILAFGKGMSASHADPRFARFFAGEASDGAWRIGEPLLRAFASASFAEGTRDFDLDSVLAFAAQLDAADSA